jgi:hypothetical protein
VGIGGISVGKPPDQSCQSGVWHLVGGIEQMVYDGWGKTAARLVRCHVVPAIDVIGAYARPEFQDALIPQGLQYGLA